MKYKRFITHILFVLLSIIMLCGCAAQADPQSVERVSEALEKIINTDSAHIKGTIEISMSAGNIDMGIDFDMKKASSDDIEMSMHMAGFLEMDMEMYGKDGKYYIYVPQISDKYIDVSSQYNQKLDEYSFFNMSMFDFDAGTTSMNVTEVGETGSLKVDVNLSDEQMKALIKKVYAERNMGSDALSGQSLSGQSNTTLDIIESMHIDSAQYTIYVDKNNNISKCELSAKLSVNSHGQNVKLDITANYDVLETGDSVTVEMPDIQPGDIITH